ncbi:MAG: four helix bundle protein [Ginsengibacter sp.]
MFLKLNHQKLDVYTYSKRFVIECYKLTKQLPSDEKFGMISQIRRAGLSVHLNIAEGSPRKSEVERKRYYEISRGSIVEIDAALDIAKELNYLDDFDLNQLQESMIKTFKLLSGLIVTKAVN